MFEQDHLTKRTTPWAATQQKTWRKIGVYFVGYMHGLCVIYVYIYTYTNMQSYTFVYVEILAVSLHSKKFFSSLVFVAMIVTDFLRLNRTKIWSAYVHSFVPRRFGE